MFTFCVYVHSCVQNMWVSVATGSEVTSEGVHAALSLISLYTDSSEAARGGAVARYSFV